MANVLLGVTGSVAAILTPELYAALRAAGHAVRVVCTSAAVYFCDVASIAAADPGRPARNRDVVFLDEDEWPRTRYQRDDAVLHIELRRWADVFLIAPLDANTLAKLATGLADNCLTCVWRAWDPARPVVLSPAMNTLMWEHPLTVRHLGQLASAALAADPPSGLDSDGLVEWINETCRRLRIVPPISKRLACGDVGVGAMAAVEQIVNVVCESVR